MSLPALPGGVIARASLTETSLTLPPDLSHEEWEEMGVVLGQAERSVQWWLGDWRVQGERRYGSLAEQSEAAGVDYDTLNAARWVAERVELVRRRTTLSWSHHREVAALDPDEQDRWLDEAEVEGLSVHELRKAMRRARPVLTATRPLPAGKFDVLLADPPWQYDFVEADNRAIENQYPTLTADEIACFEDADQRPVADLPADDAVLFLWATNPKLTEAVRVMEGWGFTYVTNAAWVKDRIGMGYWFRQRHELLLVGRRGEFPAPPESARLDSVIEAPRGAHSVKPEQVYALIEAMYPEARRVEVFARNERPGWTAWGNQV